jgi:1-acyl-sn-glycerol-3-phosphate acyltransferase
MSSIAPTLPASIPQRPSLARRLVGTWGLRLLGWRIEGNIPDAPRLVLTVAPHTSNWDFVMGFLAYLALQLDTTWFGKHSLFRWPMGPLFRYFGGIPIERSKSANMVDSYVAEFARRERMVLALAPEGTRSLAPEWKTGFYHIAMGARALIVPVALDYTTRRVRISAPLTPTGDIERDLASLRRHFTSSMAKNPAGYADS